MAQPEDREKRCGTCGWWTQRRDEPVGECQLEMEGTVAGKVCDINNWKPREVANAEREKQIRLDGYIEGLRAYAWWNDGMQYVGSCGQTLKAAIALATAESGKLPPAEEPLPDCRTKASREAIRQRLAEPLRPGEQPVPPDVPVFDARQEAHDALEVFDALEGACEALEEEVADLKKELAQWLDEAMTALAFYEKDGPRKGWWDTTALRTVQNIGDRLVKLGTWERHTDGHGRRWWYRPVEKKEGTSGH